MPQPFTPAELHAQDLVHEKRAHRDWLRTSKPMPLPLPDGEEQEEPQGMQHWVAWVTLTGGTPVRIALGFQADEDTALEAAQQAASLEYRGRVITITVVARPA